MLASIAVLVAGLIALLIAERQDSPTLAVVGKLSASTAFLALAWTQGAADSPYGMAVFAALVASWVGDACLLSKRKRIFLAGIAAFLLGHVGYVVAFFFVGFEVAWAGGAAMALGIVASAIERWLSPQVDDGLRIPVRAYIVVITIMASLSFGCLGAGHSWLIPAGAVAFFVSDVTVALDRFVEARFVNRLIGLPLYYGAQVMLAMSISA